MPSYPRDRPGRLARAVDSTVMRVLVTGGSGHLGRHVVRELLRRGCTVTIADLLPPPHGSFEPDEPPAFIECDVTDAPALVSAADGCAAVVHLAGYDLGMAPTEADYVRVNAVGSWNALAAAEAAAPTCQTFVGASSIAAMGLDGQPPLYLPVDSNHPLRPTNAYGCAKESLETFGKCVAARSDGALRVAALRPSLVIRPEARAQAVADCNEAGLHQSFDVPAAALPAPIPGKDETANPAGDWGAWVDSEDCARAFADAVRTKRLFFPFQLSLVCLYRACLGKPLFFIANYHNRRFHRC